MLFRSTISFSTGEGIEAGKTKIKFKNVDIGTIKSVELSDDQIAKAKPFAEALPKLAAAIRRGSGVLRKAAGVKP